MTEKKERERETCARLFIGIPLSGTIDWQSLQDAVKHRVEKIVTSYGGHVTYERTMHMTIAFIGEVPRERMQMISDLLAEVARRHAPIDDLSLLPDGDLFGPQKTVIVVRVHDPQQRLFCLAQDVRNALRRNGVPRDENVFVPHVTLGRIRRIALGDHPMRYDEVMHTLKNIVRSHDRFCVNAVVLYESVIGQPHRIVARASLHSS